MAFYTTDILPAYTVDDWTVEGGTVRDGNLYLHAGGSAVYTYEMTGATVSGTAHVVFPHVDGVYVFYVRYDDGGDDEQSRYASSTMVSVYDGDSLDTVIGLLEASDVASIYIRILCLVAGSTSYLEPTQMYLEQPSIESVDVEYNLSTSATEPNGEWESGSPQWADNVYIWQRVATTFSDGHTEYSAPVLLQTILGAGILSIEEQYYLSTSDTECVGGTWVDDYVTWQEGCYIWCRSYITYTNQSTGTTEPVLARGYNSSYSDSASATSTTVALDEELNFTGEGKNGVYKRLTQDGKYNGLYYYPSTADRPDLYVNATMIRTGVFYVSNPDLSNPVFYADIDNDYVTVGPFTVGEDAIWYNKEDFIATGHAVYIGAMGISVSTTDPSRTLAFSIDNGDEPGLYAYYSSDNSEIGYLQVATTMGSGEDTTYGITLAGKDSIELCGPGFIIGPYSPAIDNIVEASGHNWYYTAGVNDSGSKKVSMDLVKSNAGNDLRLIAYSRSIEFIDIDDYFYATSSGTKIYGGDYINKYASCETNDSVTKDDGETIISGHHVLSEKKSDSNPSENKWYAMDEFFYACVRCFIYYSGMAGTFGTKQSGSSGTITERYTASDLIRDSSRDDDRYFVNLDLRGTIGNMIVNGNGSYSSGSVTFRRGLLIDSDL